METAPSKLLLPFFCFISTVHCCLNYWQSNNDGASSSRRPFDICYRSYHQSSGDWSYRYICNQSVINYNLTVGGYSVFKQYFHGVGCKGDANHTILEDTVPFSIYCGGEDCDVVRYRVYDIDEDNNETGQCNGDDYPKGILDINDYEERVHVIERCDDDGFVSDSYFCSTNYFYINSYNNDKCHNNGIYAAQYYFEGCNHDNDGDKYVEVIACGKDSGFSDDDKGLKTWGIIFIVLALVAVLCACSFVIYHCAKTRAKYEIN